jgi:hypothetical protein
MTLRALRRLTWYEDAAWIVLMAAITLAAVAHMKGASRPEPSAAPRPVIERRDEPRKKIRPLRSGPSVYYAFTTPAAPGTSSLSA